MNMIYMWQYNNIRFIYGNEVAGRFGQEVVIPKLFTYIKSKYALMQVLRMHVNSSTLGPYADIDPRTVSFDKPFKA